MARKNMADIKVLCLLLIAACAFLQVAQGKKHKLVAYWGQNAVYNMHKEKQYWEKDLVHFCQNSKYDVIVLAFMHIFFDARQGGLPALNFAFHCETPMSLKYPFLLRCPKIEKGIKECQRHGKQVLMSLGGAVGSYGFPSDAKAEEFALTLWHLLFEGDQMTDIRPFGSAVMDGVDLDIEGGSSKGYSAFVRRMRQHFDSGSKKYIIAAAPQCPFPDHFLGPSPGKALEDVAPMFDELYIQFYNNYCGTGNAKQFYPNLRQWLDYSAKMNGPMIFVGVPSHERAAYGRGYWRTPSEMATIYQKIKDEPRFGGIMFWDASFDQNHAIGGRIYSEHISSFMSGGGGQITTPKPVTVRPPKKTTQQPGKTTKRTVVTKKPAVTTQAPVKTTPKPVVTTSKPVKPGKVSCKDLSNGIYAHPTDCTKFIECHTGRTTVKQCGPGLKFNPVRKYCDWPQNVKC